MLVIILILVIVLIIIVFVNMMMTGGAIETVEQLKCEIKKHRHPGSDPEVKELFNLIINKLKTMDVTLDQALESVTANSSVGESVVTLLTAIKTKLDEVLSGTVLPPQVQAKINAIFEASEADKATLQAAILANTPEAPAEGQ